MTEDLQDGQEIGGVRAVNPFRSPPSALIQGESVRVRGNGWSSEQLVNNSLSNTG
jgi:hypothetical protein